MKISIIIPVYNVKEYINRCLDSVLNQDLSDCDYEIILINDGSTDNSGNICKEYSKKHSNIRYYEQQNQGQSVARNAGIEKAKGEYIWFIDSDDFIAANSLNGLYEKAVSNNLDILSFILRKLFENNPEDVQYECIQNLEKGYVYNGREAFLAGYKAASASNALFRTNFIRDNNLKFYTGIIHQDVEFSFQAMILAKKVMFIDNCPYIYYFRQNSTLSNPAPEKIIKRYVDDGIVAFSIKETAKKYSLDPKLQDKIITYSHSIIFGCILNLWRHRHILDSTIVKVILQHYHELGFYPIQEPHKTLWHRLLSSFLLNNKLFW